MSWDFSTRKDTLFVPWGLFKLGLGLGFWFSSYSPYRTCLSEDGKISFGPLDSTMPKVHCTLEPPRLHEPVNSLFMLPSLSWTFASCYQKRLINKTGSKEEYCKQEILKFMFLICGEQTFGFLRYMN